ncbi:hypothetical protein [Streptomyces sp. NPDC014894]|uniref:hypothetical protein n=1 Tax=unclassified Streptomyces TaxID=2593676 RepID=UPI0036F5D4AD
MAQTTGLVQKISTLFRNGPSACAWVGPSPANAVMLNVVSDGSPAGVAYANALIDVLTGAMTHRREVVAFFEESGSKITGVNIEPV